ncbi:hypothetical protein BVRB_021990, partial [Beta vulgaris subsp. vulgaris]
MAASTGLGKRKAVTIGGQHGSYRGYYGQRRDWAMDNRVKYLKENLEEGMDVSAWLDIGCNEGLLTMALGSALWIYSPLSDVLAAKTFKCKSMIGIDIDKELIGRAELNKTTLTEQGEDSKNDTNGSVGNDAFEGDLKFVHGDVLHETGRSNQFSVISCFSVTKWIHLNHGDPGLLKLFDTIFRMLKPNGLFILEAQPWKSYQKRRRLNDVFATNIRNIQTRPTDF